MTTGLIDPTDCLPLIEIHDWAVNEKHLRIAKYVAITRSVRPKWTEKGNPTTYIELFAGPGRGRIVETGEIVDGSPLVAAKAARHWGTPFTEILIGDESAQSLDACTKRLSAVGEYVKPFHGPATTTVDGICATLSPYGYHFAFLDPFNISQLDFGLIRKLAGLTRMDLLIHFSVGTLQRNLHNYVKNGALDRVVPGWETAVDLRQKPEIQRRMLVQHWLNLLANLDLYVQNDSIELISGATNQPLYWLVMASKHKLGNIFWDRTRDIGPQSDLFA